MSPEYLNTVPMDWEQHFEPSALTRGRAVQRQGKVIRCELASNHPGMKAVVQGSQPKPYKVDIVWGSMSDGVIDVDGSCTCPMAYNCKHVVAAILETLNAKDSKKIVQLAPKLSEKAKTWLEELHQAAVPPPGEPDIKSDQEQERLAYMIKLESTGYGTTKSARPQLVVHIFIVRKLQNGAYGQGDHCNLEQVLNARLRPSYANANDLLLLRRLRFMQPPQSYYGQHVLSGTEGAALLDDILKTGHCHWRGTGKKHPPLTLGLPRAAKLEWRADGKGMQSPGLDVTPPASSILPLSPPWYVDEKTGSCGPLDTGLPPNVAEAWFNAPTLTPDEAELVGEELVRRYPEMQVPLPRRIVVEAVSNVKPVPCLKLYSIKVSQQNYGYYYGRSRGAETIDLNLARVEFDYEGHRVAAGAPGAVIEQFHEGKLRRIQRQPKSELTDSAQLIGCGFIAAADIYYNYRLGKNGEALTLTNAQEWFNFCKFEQPQLAAAGWRIEIDESFSYRLAEPENWYVDAEDGSGIDWFGVSIGVQLDGKKLNLLPILLDLMQVNPQLISEETLAGLKEDSVLPIQLPDGRFLPFPAQRLKEMLGVLLELFDPKALDKRGRLRLPKLRAAELSGIGEGGADWRWFGGKELKELSKKLRSFGGIQEVAPSPNLRATLRGYQQAGLNWLQFLREYNLAGILADDMGLGKTVQALAHLLHERESGRMDKPSLVVAPTSLMTNWRQEAERFAPGLKVLVLHGGDRKQHFDNIKNYDLVITSYPLLPRDQATLIAQEFHYVILDEAQFIKNPKTQYAQVVCQLQARHRLCLTGTPMENHLGELWSLFNFLLPGFLADETRFRKVFRNPIEKGASEERRKILARRIAPFTLRRRKEEVVKELPPKTEIIQNVELSGAQRDLYETIRLAMHARVREEVSKKGLSRSHIVILDALLKLRQVCCDPRLLPMDSAKKIKESAKLQLLMDLLPEMISEGRRILLFSQFTSMLALIEEELAREKIPYVLLTGKTTDRATPIERFQKGEVPLFLISLKAGGTGLNLTAADTVIHYDPWWNPAVENQATDRAHRIGQDKKVFVYKLMTVGTVETKILELQKRKKDLVEGLLDEDRKESVNIKPEDLEVLFAPIG